MRRKPKPIHVFYSPLSQKFYASRAYKEIRPGVIQITGQQFDVTQDIAQLVLTHDIEFKRIQEKEKA